MFSRTSSWNHICQFTPQIGPQKQSYLKWKRETVWNVTSVPIRDRLQEMSSWFLCSISRSNPKAFRPHLAGSSPLSVSPQLTSESTENPLGIGKAKCQKILQKNLMLIVFKHGDHCHGEVQDLPGSFTFRSRWSIVSTVNTTQRGGLCK